MSAVVPDFDNLDSTHHSDAGSPPSQQIQVINDRKEFTSKLSSALDDRWNLSDQGFDYNVVAVFGSQSTGKSTLLNRLFNAQFDVMDETERRQTTKGIWVCKARASNTLVMDVEGTDGRERGEDQDFERKSALFSMSVAEVLIVNMWEQSVGLYNGANMGLLKTVFEVNLQLFQTQGSPKTCIFFVLRDFTNRTPLQKLADTLINDLKKIWDSLSKPPGKESAQITDFFDFEYAGVPHKIYATEQFDAAVEDLRERFYDKKSSRYIFKTGYHKRIPIDGFPHFAEAIWEQIVKNRDLDLPTQQELLAQFRCDEIAKVIYNKFGVDVKPLRSRLDAGNVVDNLGASMQQLTVSALASFDKDASRYNAAVYKSKRSAFADQMHTVLSVLFVQQLRNLHKRGIILFNESLQTRIKAGEADFANKLKLSFNEAESYFNNGAQAASIILAEWTYDEQLSLFVQELGEECVKQRTEAMERLTKKLDKSIKTRLVNPITDLFCKPTKLLWVDVLRTTKDVMTSISDTLTKSLSGFDVESSVILQEVKQIKIRIWDLMMEIVQAEIAEKALLEKLRERFEAKFRYDDKGIPRFWSPADDIDGTFKIAHEQADELLTIFSEIRVPFSEIDTDIAQHNGIKETPIMMLSVAQQENARLIFNREAHSQFMEAKRSTVATTAKIPPWFIILTVALGWNELMAVLWNPMLTMMLLGCVAIAFGIWKTNMAGPLFHVARAATGEVTRQVSTGLHDRGFSMTNLMNHPTITTAKRTFNSAVNLSRSQSEEGGESYELSRRKTATGSKSPSGVDSTPDSPKPHQD
ncbi:Dynamin-like GTPase that mediates homotypic ER fusion [Batrachochytrium dendrobatidis]|nr:Dynamin-like GTPase that mediates homotypic ER fusion [Batrachochytrium dendrobatidis]